MTGDDDRKCGLESLVANRAVGPCAARVPQLVIVVASPFNVTIEAHDLPCLEIGNQILLNVDWGWCETKKCRVEYQV